MQFHSDAYTRAYSNWLLIEGAVLLTKALNSSLIRSGSVEDRNKQKKEECRLWDIQDETSGLFCLRVLPLNVDCLFIALFTLHEMGGDLHCKAVQTEKLLFFV